MDMLLQYHRKRRGGKNVKAGVLLARKLEVGKKKKVRVLVGWSKCKLAVDAFDAERGKLIADGRISTHLEERGKHSVPDSMADDVKAFVERCKRYFKVESVEVA